MSKLLITIDSEPVAILINKPIQNEMQLLPEQVRVHDHLGALLVVFTVIKWGMYNVTAVIANALTVVD